MKRFTIRLLIIICLFTTCRQMNAQRDSTQYVPLSAWGKMMKSVDKATSTRGYQMTFIGAPLILGGIIVKQEDDHFSNLRNAYLPKFSYHYDDIMQYFPAMAMLGIKSAGIKGRSSWGRMLVSDAFSAAIMASTVNLLKNTTQVKRPDGSNNHSFPSGHTATAFMTATMMHKEYGLTRSPLYSIGAYSLAAVTGITRQLNNKHWMSDVMVGAGIGIISTELGYYFADLLFKNKGILRKPIDLKPFNIENKPSFAGLYLGFNLMPGEHEINENLHFDMYTGSNAGFEGAYFFNKHIGIGGRTTVANMPVSFVGDLETTQLDMISIYAGPYFSYPLSSYWLLGSKALVGYNYTPATTLKSVSFGNTHSLAVGTGVSMTFLAKHNLGFRFFIDYSVMQSPFRNSLRLTNIITLGGSVAVLL